MRHLLHLLIVTMLAGMFTSSHAEELYLGRVIAVDREAGLLSVALIDPGGTGEVDSASQKRFDVKIPKENLPDQLHSGGIVRIWGKISEKRLTLEASQVMLTRQGSRTKDPTGVRRRIGKSRGHHGGRGRGNGHGRR
jgi:hypothetical protein